MDRCYSCHQDSLCQQDHTDLDNRIHGGWEVSWTWGGHGFTATASSTVTFPLQFSRPRTAPCLTKDRPQTEASEGVIQGFKGSLAWRS